MGFVSHIWKFRSFIQVNLLLSIFKVDKINIFIANDYVILHDFVSTISIWIKFSFIYSKVSLIFPLHYVQTCLSVNVSMYPKNRNFTIKYQHINVLSSDRDGHASFESKHVLIYLWKGDILDFTYMIRMKKMPLENDKTIIVCQ